MLIARKLYNPHPDHCRNCTVIRLDGWRWNPRRRLWENPEARAEAATAGLAYDWTIYGCRFEAFA